MKKKPVKRAADPQVNALNDVIADLATAALQKVKDKESMKKITDATGATFEVGKVVCDAVMDCVITPSEVDGVADALRTAVIKIIIAAKRQQKKVAKKPVRKTGKAKRHV